MTTTVETRQVRQVRRPSCHDPAVADRLIGTGEAARELQIDPRTLSRWAAAGHVTPALTTAGGHLRWDLDELRREVAAFGQRPT